jgi:hypothetical protein
VNGTLEERVARLEATEAIHALKARYARLADQKYTSDHRRVGDAAWAAAATAQAECFTADAQWFGGAQFGGTISGRAALAEWFTRSPWRFAMHFYVAPQLTLTSPQTAEGRWRLWQIGLPIDASPPVLLAATTYESYRRSDDAWFVSGMRFEEIQQLALADAPAVLTCTLARTIV